MRKLGTLAVLLLYPAALLILLAAPAMAEIEGPCTAAFNGYHFDDLDTPAEARDRLVIEPGESVVFYAAVPDTDLVYVDILFPPFAITLLELEADEPSDQGSNINEVEGELDLGAFAEYGSGIFQFVGRTDDCTGNAYFIIGGVDPWETVVGKTAIGITGAGVLIGLTSWIPALVAGGGGVIRSAIAGGPVGIGVAVLVQQAGWIPLSATSVGVAVVGSSVGSVLISKGLAGIHGVMSGGTATGGAMPQPPPLSPPPAGGPPPPEKIFIDDARLLGGDVTPIPDATLTPQPPSAGGPPPPEKIFIDDARLLGGDVTPVPDATLTPQPPVETVPDATLTPQPPVEGVPDATLTPQPPTTTPPHPAPTPPTPTTAPPPPAPTPPTTTPPATPGTTPPAPTAPTGPPPSPAVPPGTTAPSPASSPPPSTGAPTPAPTPQPPSPTPPVAAPGGAASAGGAGIGSGAGLAGAGAVGAGVLGAASRAVAAQKRAMDGGEAFDPHWFCVSTPTDMYGLDNYEDVIGRLRPGTWYEAKATYDEWVHAVDRSTGLEGWVAKHAVTRQSE